MKKKPNILLLGIDSLLSTHMSCYGYHRQTTPHMDRFAEDAVLFENTISPNVPTTPGYACMLTGKDIFNTQCVALRHKGSLPTKVKTLPEILKKQGYNTSNVGFKGFASARGFDTYVCVGSVIVPHRPVTRPAGVLWFLPQWCSIVQVCSLLPL